MEAPPCLSGIRVCRQTPGSAGPHRVWPPWAWPEQLGECESLPCPLSGRQWVHRGSLTTQGTLHIPTGPTSLAPQPGDPLPAPSHRCPKGLWEKALAMGVPEGAGRALPFPRGLCRTLPHPSWGSSAPGQQIALGMCVLLLQLRRTEHSIPAGPTASASARAILGGLGDRRTLQGTQPPPAWALGCWPTQQRRRMARGEWERAAG